MKIQLRYSLAVVVVAIALTAFRSPEPEIVGRWLAICRFDFSLSSRLEVFEDNTCVLNECGKPPGTACQWTVLQDGRVEFAIRDTSRILLAERRSLVFGADKPPEGDTLALSEGGRDPAFLAREGSSAGRRLRSVARWLQGMRHYESGRYEQALPLLQEAADSGLAGAENSLAWAYATCRDSRYWNGEEAIKYARRAVEEKRSFQYVDTLAAAYARVGDFEEAIESMEEAQLLAARAAEKEDISQEEYEQYRKAAWRRLDEYRQNRATVEDF